jgi:hypothetical protein
MDPLAPRLSTRFCSVMDSLLPVPKRFKESQHNDAKIIYCENYQQRGIAALQAVIEKHPLDFLVFGISQNKSEDIHADFQKAYRDHFPIYLKQRLAEQSNQEELDLPSALLEVHQVTMNELTSNFIDDEIAAKYSERMNTLFDEIETLLSTSDREDLREDIEKYRPPYY